MGINGLFLVSCVCIRWVHTLKARVCLKPTLTVNVWKKEMKANGRFVAKGVKTCIQLYLIFSVSHSSRQHLKTLHNFALGVVLFIQTMLSSSEGRKRIVQVLSTGPRAMDVAGSAVFG